MKYAIYGAGSLGIVLSAYLKQAGEEFDLIDRNIESVNAINANGVKVVGKANITQKVNAILETRVREKYDIVFLMTKQFNQREIVEKASKFLNEGGVICTCQNGLPEASVAEVIGANRTFGCAVAWGATRKDYGVSELTSEPLRKTLSFSFGSFNGNKGPKFEEIVRIFSIMGDVKVEDNFIGARWSKLLINSAFSGMSAVTGGTFGDVAEDKQCRKIVQAIIKECIDVAKVAGIKIEPIQGKNIVALLDYKCKFKKWLSFVIIPLAIKKHKLLKASMLQDLEKGLTCEIDAINGIVCEYGRKYIFPTPYNDKVVELIHKIENKELTVSFDNIKYFEQITMVK